jgi:hypothetical protein
MTGWTTFVNTEMSDSATSDHAPIVSNMALLDRDYMREPQGPSDDYFAFLRSVGLSSKQSAPTARTKIAATTARNTLSERWPSPTRAPRKRTSTRSGTRLLLVATSLAVAAIVTATMFVR